MHEYQLPIRVVEVTPPRHKTEHDNFAETLPEYVAQVIDLNRNVVYLEDYKNEVA